MNKIEIVKKLVKILTLYNNPSASIGEKEAARYRITELCEKYKLRIEGSHIIDIEAEEANKKRKFEELNSMPKPTIIDPEKTNQYVIFNGKKYYHQKGQTGGPVPRNLYSSRDKYLY